MSTLSTPVLVRHGTCRLRLFINSDEHKLKLRPSPVRGGRFWSLTKSSGERAGSSSAAARVAGVLSSPCPDHERAHTACKHIRAMVAAGLISGRPAKGGA